MGKRGRKKGKPDAASETTDSSPTLPQDEGHYDSSLYWVIQKGTASLPMTISDWINAYKDDKKVAVFDLIHTIFRTTGSKTLLTYEVYNSTKPPVIVSMMEKAYKKEPQTSLAFPIVQPNIGKKFASTLKEFMSELMHQTKKSIVYDGFFFPVLSAFVNSMANSTLLPFRATATLIGMKLMTGLVGAKIGVLQQLDVSRRQLKVVLKGRKESDRIEILQNTIIEMKENLTELDVGITDMIHGCFVHRTRDYNTNIRLMVIKELDIWMGLDATLFRDQFKYVKAGIGDPSEQVRLAALQILKNMTEQEELTDDFDFHLLLNSCKPVLLKLTLHRNDAVVQTTINIFINIFKYFNQSVPLKASECACVNGLVYASKRDIGVAAGRFLVTYLENCPSYAAYGRDQKFLRNLVDVHKALLNEAEIVDASWYLVGSLIEHTKLLVDWSLMIKILLESDWRLEDKCFLVGIMCSCAKLAVKGPRKIEDSDKPAPQRVLQARIKERMKLTDHLMPTLPSLLNLFSDPQERIRLLSIAQLMDTSLYKEKDHNFKLMMDEMSFIMTRSDSRELLEACTRAMQNFTSRDKQTSLNPVVLIRDELEERFTQLYRLWEKAKAEKTEMDEDDLYTLSNTLCQMATMGHLSQVFTKSIFTSVMNLLTDGIQTPSLPNDVYINALSCCFDILMWINHQTALPKNLTASHKRFYILLNLLVSEKSVSKAVRAKALAVSYDFTLYFLKDENKNIFTERNAQAKFIERMGECLVECVLKEDYISEDLLMYFHMLSAQYKLNLWVTIDGSEHKIFYSNWNLIPDKCRPLLKHLFLKHLNYNPQNCLCYVLTGLKASFQEICEMPDSVRSAKKRLNLIELAMMLSKWFTSSKDAQNYDDYLCELTTAHLQLCKVQGTFDFCDILAPFCGKMIEASRRKVLRNMKSMFEGDWPAGVDNLASALKSTYIPRKKQAEPQHQEKDLKKARSKYNPIPVNVIAQPVAKYLNRELRSPVESVASEMAISTYATNETAEETSLNQGLRFPNACSTEVDLADTCESGASSPIVASQDAKKFTGKSFPFQPGSKKLPQIISSSLKGSSEDDSDNEEDLLYSSQTPLGKSMKSSSLSPVPKKIKRPHLPTDIIQSVILESDESNDNAEVQDMYPPIDSAYKNDAVDLNRAIRMDTSEEVAKDSQNLSEVAHAEATSPLVSATARLSAERVQDMLEMTDASSSDCDRENLSRWLTDGEINQSPKSKNLSQVAHAEATSPLVSATARLSADRVQDMLEMTDASSEFTSSDCDRENMSHWLTDGEINQSSKSKNLSKSRDEQEKMASKKITKNRRKKSKGEQSQADRIDENVRTATKSKTQRDLKSDFEQIKMSPIKKVKTYTVADSKEVVESAVDSDVVMLEDAESSSPSQHESQIHSDDVQARLAQKVKRQQTYVSDEASLAGSNLDSDDESDAGLQPSQTSKVVSAQSVSENSVNELDSDDETDADLPTSQTSKVDRGCDAVFDGVDVAGSDWGCEDEEMSVDADITAIQKKTAESRPPPDVNIESDGAEDRGARKHRARKESSRSSSYTDSFKSTLNSQDLESLKQFSSNTLVTKYLTSCQRKRRSDAAAGQFDLSPMQSSSSESLKGIHNSDDNGSFLASLTQKSHKSDSVYSSIKMASPTESMKKTMSTYLDEPGRSDALSKCSSVISFGIDSPPSFTDQPTTSGVRKKATVSNSTVTSDDNGIFDWLDD